MHISFANQIYTNYRIIMITYLLTWEIT